MVMWPVGVTLFRLSAIEYMGQIGAPGRFNLLVRTVSDSITFESVTTELAR
jgi:hypothetical protein